MEPNKLATDAGNAETSLFHSTYDKEVQQDIWNHERKRVTRSLLFIAGILFLGDLISLATANMLTATTIGYTLILPLAFCGLAFFARLQPMIAVVVSLVLLVALMGYSVYAAGPSALLSGLLFKALLVFLVIQAFRQAKEAEAARKKLTEFGE